MTTVMEASELSIEELVALQQRASDNKRTSEKYRVIGTPQLIEFVEEIIEKTDFDYNYEILASNKAKKSSKHIVQFDLLHRSNIVEGDQIIPRILISNSYNRECSLNVYVGLFRMVCTNGLMVGSTQFNSRIVHLHGTKTEDKLENLGNQIAAAIEYIEGDLVKDMQKLVNTETNQKTEEKIIEGLKLSSKMKSEIEHIRLVTDDNDVRININREEDKDWNLWTLYNTVNEVVRNQSKTETGFFKKNATLMDQILQLAA